MSDSEALINARMELHQLTAEHGHSHDDLWSAIASLREEVSTLTSTQAQLEEARRLAEEAVTAIEEAQAAVTEAEAEPENIDAQIDAEIAVDRAENVSEEAASAVADISPTPDSWLFRRIGEHAV